jgi:hypothetical protein
MPGAAGLLETIATPFSPQEKAARPYVLRGNAPHEVIVGERSVLR